MTRHRLLIWLGCGRPRGAAILEGKNFMPVEMNTVTLPIVFVGLLALLYGITMKLADLFNEHGLRWFRGDAAVFGLLWGIFGSLLVLTNPIVSNALVAQMACYVIRRLLDYWNHAVAATMIIVTFLATGQPFLPLPFTIFFFGLTALGLVRDYYGQRKEPRWLYHLNEPAWYYLLVPLAYWWLTDHWIALLVFPIYRAAYSVIKYGLYWRGSYSDL